MQVNGDQLKVNYPFKSYLKNGITVTGGLSYMNIQVLYDSKNHDILNLTTVPLLSLGAKKDLPKPRRF